MSTRPAHTDLPYSHAGDEDQARLEALSEALDPITISVLEALPDTGDAACLELGAGNGTIARWMADHLPSAQVTATELDLRHLEAEGRKNLDFVRHDVTQDQFPEVAFGLIHARWLLHHLPVRERVLPEITKWLAPGGHLVLEEPALFPPCRPPRTSPTAVSPSALSPCSRSASAPTAARPPSTWPAIWPNSA
ncbi:class I SAM-dependent methyltransferase [Streptomyces sp. NPDC005904]|uniref:class I SAM-dependent methyltransferase n=1 Tax=Streptomyces sp. NPDC005904 TaxID=3154570 RepID=UPI0034028630